MKTHLGWYAQDLITRDDVLQILTSNLNVSSHPVPQNMGGVLFCVNGISQSCDAIMDLLELRANLKSQKETIAHETKLEEEGR